MLTIKLWVAESLKINFNSKQIYSSYFTKQTIIPIILQVPGHLLNIGPSRFLLEHFSSKCCCLLVTESTDAMWKTNLLPSSERLFQGERNDEGCASSNVAGDSDCKRLRFIVKRWWHFRCHQVFSRYTFVRESGINLYTYSIRCLESAFSFSLLCCILSKISNFLSGDGLFDTLDIWRI